MAKNDDLDMQTFQIYQDEETDMTTLVSEQKEQPKQGGVKGMFSSFKKKKTGEIPKRENTPAIEASESKSKPKVAKAPLPDSLKGILIGVALIVLFILADKVMNG